MKSVGVVFRLESGDNVQIIMPDPNARIIIRDWSQGILKGFVGSLTDPYPWMIEVAFIKAIQMVPLQEQFIGEEAASIPKKLPPNCSGINSGRN